jgi:hypothetical protein
MVNWDGKQRKWSWHTALKFAWQHRGTKLRQKGINRMPYSVYLLLGADYEVRLLVLFS